MNISKRKVRKGISDAVVSFILIIAAVIISLVVVGFAFGLFGSFGGSAIVTQVGTAVITGPTNGNYQIVVTLHSTGNVQVISAMFTGVGTGVAAISTSLSPGINTITLNIPTTDVNTQLQPGATYTLTLSLSNGQTVTISALYEG